MTEARLRGMFCNPIYAGLGPFPRLVPDEIWVACAVQMIEEEGPEQFLVNLLYCLRESFKSLEEFESPPEEGISDEELIREWAEDDATIRLTNEISFRQCMYIETDKSIWRMEYQPDSSQELGAILRLYRSPISQNDFREITSAPWEPDEMRTLLGFIEDHDKELGDTSTWRIVFPERGVRSKWVLPWNPKNTEVLARLFEELESGEFWEE